MRKLFLLLIFFAIVLIVWTSWKHRPSSNPAPVPVSEGTEISYSCNEGKTIDAILYEGEMVPSSNPDMPPIPGGTAHIALSDGRVLDLAQTISADGVRYSNGDPSLEGGETFVFWSKGNSALVLENNQEQSYLGCVEVAKTSSLLPTVYTPEGGAFSIRLPEGFIPDSTYNYSIGPEKKIEGVKFTINPSLSEGTNLSKDSYISIEQMPVSVACDATLFLDGSHEVMRQNEAGTEYSVALASNAGAGNRYEETVYAFLGSSPCTAIRYVIHYTVLQNYPPGAVKEFNKQALVDLFDTIRKTFIFGN